MAAPGYGLISPMNNSASPYGHACYPCPDCSAPVTFGRPCMVCLYGDDPELAVEQADAELRAMFPELSDAEVEQLEAQVDAMLPPSQDALDLGWM